MTEISDERKQEIRGRWEELKKSGLSPAEVKAALCSEFSLDEEALAGVVDEGEDGEEEKDPQPGD